MSERAEADERTKRTNSFVPKLFIETRSLSESTRSIPTLSATTAHEPEEEDSYGLTYPVEERFFRKPSNYIRTTKYTLLSFIPLNLYYQFRRFYNIYFLLGALSVFAGVSSLSPISQIFPLVVVLAFAAVKEAIEDYGRYRADTTANNIPVTVVRGGVKTEVLSMHVQPGDVVYLEKGEKFPVDAMLISSSYEDGTCYVETAELDG
ncbi:hypothetical protein BDK51DRAFT_49773, partial [Blyttiomyces helicus]